MLLFCSYKLLKLISYFFWNFQKRQKSYMELTKIYRTITVFPHFFVNKITQSVLYIKAYNNLYGIPFNGIISYGPPDWGTSIYCLLKIFDFVVNWF